MKSIVTVFVLIAGMMSSNLALAEGDAIAGEGVYFRACKSCHETGMMGAPKPSDKAVWAGRMELGAGTLTKRAINGYNKMPPRGNCRSCSDQDIADAVAYMLGRAK